MSAGTGIRHAEYNREDEPTRIFQIWIEPAEKGCRRAGTRRPSRRATGPASLVPLASGRPGHEGALPIIQDAAVLGATLNPGQSVTYRLEPGRQAYLVGATGRFTVNGVAAKARDGVVVRDAEAVTVEAQETSEILLADLPGGWH